MLGFGQITCTKVRDGNKRIVQLKEGDPRGRHVVIVDDLVQSGGTLIECQVSLVHSIIFSCHSIGFCLLFFILNIITYLFFATLAKVLDCAFDRFCIHGDFTVF